MGEFVWLTFRRKLKKKTTLMYLGPNASGKAENEPSHRTLLIHCCWNRVLVLRVSMCVWVCLWSCVVCLMWYRFPLIELTTQKSRACLLLRSVTQLTHSPYTFRRHRLSCLQLLCPHRASSSSSHRIVIVQPNRTHFPNNKFERTRIRIHSIWSIWLRSCVKGKWTFRRWS